MNMLPRWALDANHLGMRFRAAFAQFQDVLAREAPTGGQAVSMEAAQQAARRMHDALGDARATLGRAGTAGTRDAENDAVQFAFASVVDETLINTDWAGQAAWDNEFLLEWVLFKSRSGGQGLFDRIDQALRGSDRVNRDIAQVYLYCLTLGFAGVWRGRAGSVAELARLRAALFDFVYAPQPRIDEPGFVLAEAPGENVVRTEAQQRSIAGEMRVYLYAAALVALPLLVSGVLWLTLRPILAGVLKAGGA